MKQFLFLIVFLVMSLHSFAQGCVVCTSNASALDEKGARGLNLGIIYLAFLPLTIMLTLGFLWWKANRKNI